MYYGIKRALIIFFCSSFALSLCAEKSIVENFIDGFKEVIEAGRVYIENTDRIADKQAVYACAHQYINQLKTQPYPKEKVSEFYACLKPITESEYSDNNMQFGGFEAYFLELENDEEFNNRWFINRWGAKQLIKLPHPLMLLKKAADDIGQYAFLDKKIPGHNHTSRQRFVNAIKDCILLILDQQNNGCKIFELKLKEKVSILADLCENHTVFQAEEMTEAQKNELVENQYPSETLIEMGQKIAGILASAGALLILPYKERVRLGVDVAQVLFPTYSSILRERTENRDLKLSMNDLVKLGDEEIKAVEQGRVPGKLEDDYDAKFFTVNAILYQVNKLQETKSAKSVKKAEFKEKNPLENIFKI